MLSGYLHAKKQVQAIRSQLDSLVIKMIPVSEFWTRNINYQKSEDEPIDHYLKMYSSMDSVFSRQIYKDMIYLYESGKYDSLSVMIESKGDSSEILFKYKLRPTITSVELLSDIAIDSLTINRVVNELLNKPVDGKIIFKICRDLISAYKEKGYILFAHHQHEFDSETGKLTLEFRAGKVSGINISSETSKTVIEREFKIKSGDILKYSVIEEGLQNLRATGLFEDIILTIDQQGDDAILNIDVEERISSLMKIGFLVDNTYNAQLGIDLRDVNILGSGTELGLFLFGGARNRAYILEHIAYRILDSYFTYKLSGYYKFNDISVYSTTFSESGNTFSSNSAGRYRQIFYGASLSLGTQLEKFGKLIFTGKYQLDEVKNKEGNVVTPYKTKVVGLRISAIVDNQNKYPYPDDGLYFNSYYETAQSIFGGDEGYIVFNGDLKYYFNLSPRHVFSPRIQLGFADKTLPLSEQFTLGGLYSFFGAHENEFRGRQIFLTSLMYQYKLPFQIFFDTYAWFRYDLGSTWDV
jgi:outer membrane protein assembly factor BamA